MTITSAEAAKLDAMCKVAQDSTLGTEVLAHQTSIAALDALVKASGVHVATAGEATAGTLDIDTSVTITGFIVQVLRAGVFVTVDAAVSAATTILTVADGTTYAVTENDVINYIVW